MTLIGQAIDRVDGPLKVTGRATYAYEQWETGQPLYGFIVGATIGHGRIAHIDVSRAERSPGVRLVMTHRNAPAQGTPDESAPSPNTRAQPALSGPEIDRYGEPVALVVATTFEQARAAAHLVDVDYAAEPGRYDFAAEQDKAYLPKRVKGRWDADTAVGSFDSAFDSAEVKFDQRYTTPYEFSQPMEPHNCLAVWLPARSASIRSGSTSSRRTSAAGSGPSSAFIPRRSLRRSRRAS
jgi:xanthine dehydrogenase YagR molybdenum-binding subunit